MSTVAADASLTQARSGSLDGDILKLYDQPFPATRQGPLFNAFSYPTKISPEGIALFIATHTQPGDTVLDVFSGSGATGIAAKLCDRPTPGMLSRAAEFDVAPQWGPRNDVLYDVSVVGSLLAEVMCDPPDPRAFSRAANQLLHSVERTHGWLYAADAPDGAQGRIRHVIWSEVLVCPDCDHETTYWDATVRRQPLALAADYVCASCHRRQRVDAAARATETVWDARLGRRVPHRRRVPVSVYGRNGTQRWSRSVSPADQDIAARATDQRLPASAPIVELQWGDLFRAGYHTGISHLHHFYTERNFCVLAYLWDAIDSFPREIQPALRILVLSFNASHSTLMTRVVVKQNQGDFVLTGAQSGVLYISALPVEKNVFDGVRRKAKTLSSAFSLVRDSKSTVAVVNASSAHLDLADASVDYVFTDPPFGDFIPYAEINQINELWLGATTDRAEEAVISTSTGKDVDAYRKLLTQIFAEVDRVLTDTGVATVVFHSAKAAIWRALVAALKEAGLSVRATGVLDKTQMSFKQVVSTTMVRGDPLILLDKREAESRETLPTVSDLVTAVVADGQASGAPEERSRERLFSRFVTRCLVEGVPVTLGAAEFNQLLETDAVSA